MYVNEGMKLVGDLIKRFGIGPRHLVLSGHSLGANVAAEVANAFGCRAVGFCLPMLCGDRRNYQDLTVCNVYGDPVAVAFNGVYNNLLPGRDLVLKYHRSFVGPSEQHSSDRVARQLYVTYQETNATMKVTKEEAAGHEKAAKLSSPRVKPKDMSPRATPQRGSAADFAAEAATATEELLLSEALVRDLDKVAQSPRSSK